MWYGSTPVWAAWPGARFCRSERSRRRECRSLSVYGQGTATGQLGKRFRFGTDPAKDHWETVVGVVEDVRLRGFRQASADPMIYVPLVGPTPQSWAVGSPAYVVKSTRAASMVPEVRALLREYAPESPMYRIFTMEGLAARSLAQLSFTMLMLAIASGLALILGVVGLLERVTKPAR